MRIQHNIAALNSYRQLGTNNTATSKNLEKLSSGYKINRAGDDAAGLAISEKMRAQITGLEKAQDNANDGISLVQTAEGALTEVHSMLNRMTELAEQSANGTYDNTTDRANLQKEVDSLKSEINRISEGTNFNGINLLDGSLGAKTGATDVNMILSGAKTPITAKDGVAFSQKITIAAGVADGADANLELKYLDKEGNAQTANISFKANKTTATTHQANAVAAIQEHFGDAYTVTNTGNDITITAKDKADDQTQIFSVKQTEAGADVTGATFAAVTAGKADTFTIEAGTEITIAKGAENFLEIDGTKYQILTNGEKPVSGAKALYVDQSTGTVNNDSATQIAAQLKEYGIDAKADGTDLVITKADASDNAKGGLTLQIGDTSDQFNKLTVTVGNMSSKSLGIGDIDISDQDGAAAAMDLIKSAINTVSSTRGDIGAIQNRLEHTINNLGVTTENVTAAESRIRDVDMAKEMMNYTKNNILIQASQSMLAQANQLPQGVLQLLQ